MYALIIDKQIAMRPGASGQNGYEIKRDVDEALEQTARELAIQDVTGPPAEHLATILTEWAPKAIDPSAPPVKVKRSQQLIDAGYTSRGSSASARS